MVIAIIAVVKAGGVYLALASDDSPERTNYIVRDSGAVLALHLPSAPVAGVLGMELSMEALDLLPSDDSSALLTSAGPTSENVNLIYTSGSTGDPKGVLTTEIGLLNQVLWSKDFFEISRSDRILHKAPVSFDAATWEIWATLLSGATLVILPAGAHRDPRAIIDWIRRESITICHVVPSILRPMVRFRDAVAALGSLRLILCGGEPLPPALMRAVARASSARFFNMYGPAEASIQVSSWSPESDDSTVLIGLPIANCTLLALDERLRVRPWGEAGELAISGIPLASGYHGRPDLTARAFRHLPEFGRVYLTGDIVEFTPGGIRFLGRRDNQVKIAGNRVELDFLEESIARMEGVLDSALVVAPIQGAESLVAFIVTEDGSPREYVEVIRHLRGSVPDAHLPQFVRMVAAMPTTSSGKVDRRTLRDWATADQSDNSIARLWSRLLGSHDPGVRFYDAGGSSITAITLSNALVEYWGIEVTVTQILTANPNLTDIEAMVGQSAAGTFRAIQVASRPDPSRAIVSPDQRQLWTHLVTHDNDPGYNVVGVVEVRARLDPTRLARAWQSVMDSLDVLRTEFVIEGDELVAKVADTASAAFEQESVETSTIGWSDKVKSIARRVGWLPFAPDALPRARLLLISAADAEKSALVFAVDHLVSDQRSLEVLVGMLHEAYVHPAGHLDRPIQFPDLVATSLRDPDVLKRDLEYHVHALRNAPAATHLSFDTRKPRRPGNGGTSVQPIDRSTVRLLESFASAHQTTTAIIGLTSFLRVLSGWTGEPTVVAGVPVSRRDTISSSDAVGFFMRTIPIAFDVEFSADRTVQLREVRNRFLEAFEHSEPTLGEILSATQWTSRHAGAPLLRFWFNDVSRSSMPTTFDGAEMLEIPVQSHWNLFDVGLYVVRHGESLELQLSYSLDMWTSDVAECFLSQVAEEVRAFVMGEPEAEETAAKSGTTSGRSPLELVNRFETLVIANPHAPQMLAGAESRTRKLVWSDMIRLASRLDSVAETGPVVIFARRDPALIPAIFAGWRAGRAVALVDPGQPRHVIDSILRDLKPAVTVTIAGGHFVVSPEVAEARDSSEQSLASVTTPTWKGPYGHMLATSGSSGSPKVVLLPKDALAIALEWYIDEFDIGPSDVFVLSTAVAHDPVFRDAIVPVLAGATLVVPREEVVASPTGLISALAEANATVWHAAVSKARLVAGLGESGGLTELRLIVLHGESAEESLFSDLARIAPHARIVLVYGLTETAQVTAYGEWRPGRAETGLPLDHIPPYRAARIRGSERPRAGWVGEIVIAGRGLADGAPEFMTGDLGFFGMDGGLVVTGRQDRQRKVHGNRVELDSVAGALHSLDAVDQAAVVQPEVGGTLVAAVVLAQGSSATPQDITRRLSGILPHWEVPSEVIFLDEIPRLVTGKIDYVSVEALVAQRQVTVSPSYNSSAVDHLGAAIALELATIVTSRTGAPIEIRRGDRFEDVGATSFDLLLLSERVARLSETPVPVFVVFQSKTPGSLAEYIISGEIESRPGATRPRRVSSPGNERGKRRAARRVDRE